MNLLVKMSEMNNDLKLYIIKNRVAIQRECNITIPETIVNMSNSKFTAWVQVYASRILMAKNFKECDGLKDMVLDFIAVNREFEIAENQIVMA